MNFAHGTFFFFSKTDHKKRFTITLRKIITDRKYVLYVVKEKKAKKVKKRFTILSI
jgi:hypothetical protein